MRRNVYQTVSVLLFYLLLICSAGCEKEVSHTTDSVDSEGMAATSRNSTGDAWRPGDDGIALATVNGSRISDIDLQHFIDSKFGNIPSKKLKALKPQKVLESLAAHRAMAMKQESAMSKEDLAELNRKVAAYREELLVLRYILENSPPDPYRFRGRLT